MCRKKTIFVIFRCCFSPIRFYLTFTFTAHQLRIDRNYTIVVKLRILTASYNLIRLNVVFITTTQNSAIHLVQMVSHSTCAIHSFQTPRSGCYTSPLIRIKLFTGIQFIRTFAFWINFRGNKLQSHIETPAAYSHINGSLKIAIESRER